MKKYLGLVLALTLTSGFTIYANAAHAATENCASKKAEIEKQLSYAKQYNNQSQVAGLEKALAENSKYCNDADLVQKNQQKIAQKQRKVLERENDLAKAQRTGNTQKIEKQQKKLQKALAELEQAKS